MCVRPCTTWLSRQNVAPPWEFTRQMLLAKIWNHKVLRSADAAGVTAVIAPRDNSASLNPTVRKVACGAAEAVPFIQVTNLARSLRQLQEAGVWTIGLAGEAEQSLYECDLRGPVALIMGAEGAGMRRLTRECCDYLANLPMAGEVSSLNVSVATGVCLFEAVRQRR